MFIKDPNPKGKKKLYGDPRLQVCLLCRWAFSFHLVHVGNLHAYTMWARTEEDKNKWVAAIREALANVPPLGLPALQPPQQASQQQGTRSA